MFTVLIANQMAAGQPSRRVELITTLLNFCEAIQAETASLSGTRTSQQITLNPPRGCGLLSGFLGIPPDGSRS
jgi:hypothetical protein